MNAVLKERRLRLSTKKTRIGHIDRGFHFLGIQYPGTQIRDNTTVTQANKQSVIPCATAQNLLSLGGKTTEHLEPGLNCIVPHPRTLRKAREQVNQMVATGVSPRRISSYLHHWSMWWVRTTEHWNYQELLEWFLNACWGQNPAAKFAAGLLRKARESSERPGLPPGFESGFVAAL